MTAFRASYADLKIVKTRGVCQVVLEIPLEQADAALEILGGVPRPDREVWVGVARLAENAAPEPAQTEEPAKERRRFDELPLPQQAALLCRDERFQKWFGWESEESCASHLRSRLGISSRAELVPGTGQAEMFRDLAERYRIECGLMAAPR